MNLLYSCYLWCRAKDIFLECNHIILIYIWHIYDAYSSIHIICKLKYSYDMHTYMNMHTHMIAWVHTATRTYINTHRWCIFDWNVTSDWNVFIYMYMLLNYYFTVKMDKWLSYLFVCLSYIHVSYQTGLETLGEYQPDHAD